jgi:hypothetical protein
MTGNPEAINFYFESVPTNAPVFTIHFHLPDLSGAFDRLMQHHLM